jgi:integration host factor subunit alpha
MALTKADLVDRVYARVQCSKSEATEFVEAVFETMKERLEQGEKVKISGFGNFVVSEKRARRGRNPQSGAEIVISGRRVMTFKASQVLKALMNGAPPGADGAAAAADGEPFVRGD